jgi:hypothetical protein
VLSKKTTPGTPEANVMGVTLAATPAEADVSVSRSAMTPQQRERMARRDQAKSETAQDVAAGGLTPEEEAQAQARGTLAGIEQTLRWAKQLGGYSDEELDSFKKRLIDASTGIAEKPVWKEYVGPNGERQWLDASRPELIPPGWNTTGGTEGARKREDFEQYLKLHPELRGKITFEQWLSEQKVPTSKFGVNVDSYKRQHGIPAETPLTPEQLNFVEQQIALSSAAPVTNITNTLKQNAEGWWVPIQETNRRIPGFGVILRDPMGPPPAAPTPGGARPAARSAEPPGAAPAHGAPAAAKPATGGVNASVRAGAPLFAAPNKDYSETKANYQAAIDRATTMDKNYTAGLNGDQQAMLSMVANHIGMTLGSQKGTRINQAVWNEAVESADWFESKLAKFFHTEANGDRIFDGWKGGVTLTAPQMKQMVDLAHEKVGILAEHLGRLQEQLGLPRTQGWMPPPGAPDPSQLPDGHELYNKRTKQVDAVVRGGKWTQP